MIADVLRGKSLSSVLPVALNKVAAPQRSLLQELCYGTLRWCPALERLLQLLLEKPLREKDLEVQALLACGLYQLRHMRTPHHAVINETVAATANLKRPWARALVNAVLRNYQRNCEDLERRVSTDQIVQTAHPAWLTDLIKQAWPELAETIFAANNARAPMTLRVNKTILARHEYLERLRESAITAQATKFSPDGITLESPVDVLDLPGFQQGMVSVQDEAAQLAAGLLDLHPGQRVLDACCAPGGKTCHILESEPELDSLLAIDQDSARLRRVRENLQRIQRAAELRSADCANLAEWWDGQLFQRILLDAPCSATGVIRRHPDIKLLRQPEDIAKLAATQLALMTALWPTLEPGGLLLYATCSVLPQENDQVVANFLHNETTASVEKINAGWGLNTTFGKQVLPAQGAMDGFYYARLRKVASDEVATPQ